MDERSIGGWVKRKESKVAISNGPARPVLVHSAQTSGGGGLRELSSSGGQFCEVHFQARESFSENTLNLEAGGMLQEKNI